MGTNFKVTVALVLAMLFWAFSYVWIKIAYEVFQPITTVFLRLFISTIFLFVVFGLLKKIQKIKRKDLKWVLLLAFFEPFLYFMFESFGLKTTSSTTGAVIISTIPLFSPFSALIFFNERVSFYNAMGIILSFVGVIVMIVDSNFYFNEPVVGIMLMFGAVMAGLGYNLLLKNIASKYNVYTITGYQNLIGLILFVPFFFIFEWNSFISAEITSRSVFAVVELAIFASTLAFLFLTYGIRHFGLSKASVFANLIPVFTAFLAWWILDDVIQFKHIIGIAIVVAGLLLSQLKNRLK